MKSRGKSDSKSGGENKTPEGDKYELSGDFRGAVINIKSTIVAAEEVKDIEDLPPEPGDPPFQGLQYFDEKDAARFFGRELTTARIVGRLKRTRILAIIGASGSGKSSLVRAGVLPALRQGGRLADGGLPPKDSGQWAYHVITPTAHPLESIAASLMRDEVSVSRVSQLSRELAEDPRALTLAIQQYLAQYSRKHFLLVVDQFEEIYTLCRSEDERKAFLESLLLAIKPDDEQPITILIVMRADYYANLAQDDRLREVVSQYQEFIGAMNRDELVSAIDKPLAMGGWKIQEGLIEVILDDIGYEPGALPLLSHALLETWRRRRGRTLTLSGYREAGGVRGAVAQTAEHVFQNQLSLAQQPIARMIFLRMAEIGEDNQDTRRRATFAELITRSSDELVIEAVIDILVEARLVTIGTLEPGDIKVVEVAHEALIREWHTLRQWLDQDREGLILHQQLAEDTLDWVKLNKDPGVLYRGVRLKNALTWASQHPDFLNQLEQEFLDTSQKLATEEANQLNRLRRAAQMQRLFAGIVALLVIGLGYLAYSLWFHKEPARMNGFYNIAVAEFGTIAPDGSFNGNPTTLSDNLSDRLYDGIKDQLKQNSNILVWHDGAELRKQNVTIGAVPMGDDSINLSAARELAQRLNADMLIYGNIDERENPAVLNINFYLAPRGDYNYEDLIGGFDIGSSLIIGDVQNENFSDQLNNQAVKLSWVVAGLSEAQLGHSLEALEAFLKARDIDPNSAVLEFLAGREYLFLVDRESVLTFAQDAFLEQAQVAFQRAIELDSDYARAYIGLGSAYFKRAQRLLADTQAGIPATNASEDQIVQGLELVDQAIASYQRVLAMHIDPSRYGLPLEQVANLGLGNSFRLRGEFLQIAGKSDDALIYFDKSIDVVQATLEPLKSANQMRYLTQAYEYLGASNQWKGYSYELLQDFEQSLDSYQKSVGYYDMCIAQATSTQDVIIRDEIVAGVCEPARRSVQELIDSFTGGEG